MRIVTLIMKEIFSGEAVSIKPSGTFINILGKTTAEFESGEVAYLLGEAWGQNIDNGETKQSLPEFSDARVYQNRVYSKCDKSDTSAVSYSNTQVEDVVPAHSFVNGRCSECAAGLRIRSEKDLRDIQLILIAV